MTVRILNCPTCGYPLPENIRANQLIVCQTCGATLMISEWKIGETGNAVAVATPTRVYKVTDLLRQDDLCNVYRCIFEADNREWHGMFRMTRHADDNDLVRNEAQTLHYLQAARDYTDFRAFVPMVLESFAYQDDANARARQVNILSLHEQIVSPNELYSLEEVHRHYPNGIDPRDMAWMWRRLLNVLGFAHQAGVVHGAVLPSNVMIEPREHKVVLTEWSFSVRDAIRTGDRMKALSVNYEAWYPPEVFEREIPTPSVDLYLAARAMLYLIGADPLGDGQHRRLEPELQRYFRQMIRQKPADRPQGAWHLLAEFDRVIEQLWGPRTFRVFTMPAKVL